MPPNFPWHNAIPPYQKITSIFFCGCWKRSYSVLLPWQHSMGHEIRLEKKFSFTPKTQTSDVFKLGAN